MSLELAENFIVLNDTESLFCYVTTKMIGVLQVT